ncbi:MAG: DNA-directed RNA polymerase subunit omega [Gammaproteobacteria bacterium]|jgi:DNA-directed RNA polymerase subunit omega|nr:DNA-directed RNA polymerase subunit omega [Gammaproteobacteria bacterium]MBT5406752.1 DNA-directed RNA polymerase subunit omega [Gammaproteobacteria bacterium]MBT5643701.1 DNA-directed RNA polymerase subunit omega [Gammaproteobacteria bacterium]MBT6734130.1 DNA-directed RNA polymerase subunit omega [Gammaproteobacteria bacterium]MBT7236894.1 DNA-directed RNA polymerase subunit omega [Gammaproteobacteria bacterium]|tara:strand:+ start:80 stop:502 length:423 start_codon:yes stop_codon:yes gene_type:complete
MARITIEDCLKVIDNAFDICSLAGRRAKDLASGAEPLIDCNDKPTVIALREIAAEKIGMDYFEISNKEKIESQLFGSGITEEEVVNELSQQLDETPSPLTAEVVDAPSETEEPLETKEVAIEAPLETEEVTEDLKEIKSE